MCGSPGPSSSNLEVEVDAAVDDDELVDDASGIEEVAWLVAPPAKLFNLASRAFNLDARKDIE